MFGTRVKIEMQGSFSVKQTQSVLHRFCSQTQSIKTKHSPSTPHHPGDVGGEVIRGNWTRENERSIAVDIFRAVLGTAVTELGRERRPSTIFAVTETNERPIPTVRGPALWTKNNLIHITSYVILGIRIPRESKISGCQPNSYTIALPASPA